MFPRSIGDAHQICVVMGRDAADRLAAWAGGGSIDVPKQAARRARVLDLHSRGNLTNAQIALQTAYSERHVYRIISEERDDRQSSIFDLL
ncbi:Mor transcription activator family protein [Novosphingobium aquimarinum]|uniref:Mor transcription activator family protein n=1 Tax=Novosphingobium aquimarinum TaxID=2682494 RepID=UPI0012EC8521|nr:Mor transcription activator family protein [Novosphingobium aquimarinum]